MCKLIYVHEVQGRSFAPLAKMALLGLDFAHNVTNNEPAPLEYELFCQTLHTCMQSIVAVT